MRRVYVDETELSCSMHAFTSLSSRSDVFICPSGDVGSDPSEVAAVMSASFCCWESVCSNPRDSIRKLTSGGRMQEVSTTKVSSSRRFSCPQLVLTPKTTQGLALPLPHPLSCTV
eukprot:TRINITY_DN809_c1_g1_i2.p3 TRINITY_DN809_c1_g1~~TRINITY_DN809_c1_g1_i2.p3  ORF type:complete len:115 (-),score=3.34 TRINITY_DN809_c1_g1_i2:737-1081(-)